MFFDAIVMVGVSAAALGSAFAIAAGCLRLIVGAITRDQYNVTSASAPQ